MSSWGPYSARRCLVDLKAAQKKAFIPYITAGDPSLPVTEGLVHALIRAGADLIELGVPFSDPMADGPVNQRSAERALKNKVTLAGVIDLVAKLRAQGVKIPLVLFTYFNPIYKMGFEVFAKRAREAGVSAVLALDLPPEEADEYRSAMSRESLETVFLASPTTRLERLSLIDSCSTGFVYYVSRTGVTGAQTSISESLDAELTALRSEVKGPIAVGFGISTPAQAMQVARAADAVVVGSAIVDRIGNGEGPDAIARFSEALAVAVHGR